MSTITGTLVHTPVVVEGFNSSRNSQNIVHQLVGGGESVTLRRATNQTGTLVAIFEDEADARACEADLANRRTYLLTRTDIPSASMTFVTEGTISLDLDTDTFLWVLRVGFRRVSGS